MRQTNKRVIAKSTAIFIIIFGFNGANSTLLYRQWVADGKKLSLETLIDIATKLICNGMSSVVKEKN